MSCSRFHSLFLALVFCLSATSALAVVQPERPDLEEFRAPSMTIVNDLRQVGELDPASASLRGQELTALGLTAGQGYVDVRSNRWASLMPTQALLPGTGVGNNLKWSDLGRQAPGSNVELKQAAWDAFERYLAAHQAQLRISLDELPPSGLVTVHDDGNLIQIYVQRVHQGLSVRGSRLTAVISHGNLILFGAANWGDINTPLQPTISATQAANAMNGAIRQPIGANRRAPYLQLIPTARGADIASVVPGQGFDYRLAWVLSPNVEGDGGRWEALIDAHTGDLLAFQDLVQYGSATTRRVEGGVLPITNDGTPPDGVEQAGWPMGWSDITVGAETAITDAGGNLGFCAEGTVTTTLSGQYMLMDDQCGAISESSTGNIDLGTSGGTDCTVPPGASPGNTHASRSGFFEMNQIQAVARGRLPGNFWPTEQLLATMNIPNNCNATWDGNGVNFYTSGGGCSNTGELAGVFDHEWGHGMDANDAAPGISFPGEGTADIYAALRLNDSCMGHNFRPGSPCGGYGDPCNVCSGVRDIDWANRASGIPHTVTWVNANCGGGTHCSGSAVAEAVWDLFNRDLTAAPFNFDHNTSLDIATRLSFTGMGLVGTWWTGAPPFAGCNADGGYLNYLAADDDDGSLANGTPHMSAIFAAFNRHEAACATPTVTDFGCAAGPSTAPVISSVDALDKGAQVNFSTVTGADHYDVYRTDGVFGCDQGKILVGAVEEPASEGGGLSFFDFGAQNGREYHYTVFAVGSTDACQSPASNCVAQTPADGANLSLTVCSAGITVDVGDADEFLDNCEEVTVDFDVNHIGSGTQTNVRIVSINPVSHPMTVVTTALPLTIAASLPTCDIAAGSISFQPRGMAFNDTFEVEVGVTSDELGGIVKTGTITIGFAESDLETVASKTFTFEADAEGWTVAQGTFNRDDTIGGANSTIFYEQSSANLDQQCDRIRSPLMAIDAGSTLSLWNHFRIEPFSGGTWYDRANIGLVDTGGNRTLLTPDGGRMYNADSSGPGNYGGCNEPEEGWADVMPTWAESTWSDTAFGAVAAPVGLAQLEVIYSTDSAANDDGFRFDQVTVTNVGLQIADAQTDTCLAPSSIFTDGFESGDASAWTSTMPWSGDTSGWSGERSPGNGTPRRIISSSTSRSWKIRGPSCGGILPPGNTAPEVTITDPDSCDSFVVGASIDFTGTATDVEDGDITSSLTWTSDLQGVIGSGGIFSTTALMVGTHRIVAEAIDSGSESGSAAIVVTVTPIPVAETTSSPVGALGNANHSSMIASPNSGLNLTMTASNSILQQGPMHFTNTVQGPVNLAGIVVEDQLPAALIFGSTSGCVEDPNGMPNCTLRDPLAERGGTAAYDINICVPEGLASITNCAKIIVPIVGPSVCITLVTPTIFTDGFESGDTTAWTSTVP